MDHQAVDRNSAQRARRARWIGKPPAPAMRSTQSVLDLDPDLADELSADARRIARAAAITLILTVEVGEVRISPWLQLAGSGPGLLVVDGVLVAETGVGRRTAAELLGAGDLLTRQPSGEDELLSHTVRWRALTRLKLAVLDEAFAKRTRFWPTVSASLLRRAAQRTSELNVQRAIAAQPRLELRLTLLLWHLAARWGKVETGGIRLPLPLTHHLLGRLVAAERPSVSHALSRLAHAGLITGHGDEWHLHGTVEDHLEALAEPGADAFDSFGVVIPGVA